MTFGKVMLRRPGTFGLVDFWKVRLRYTGTVEQAYFWRVRLRSPGAVELADFGKCWVGVFLEKLSLRILVPLSWYCWAG